eukprot:TRINITY_DN11183_c0_g1_i1.p2 TRINITY_DN11183_c0_g1~~TRINITY_DN11183_c0_g1_i1.p2  ORF type:complete len:132 (+),score=64.84 TRINITY_DN11183_c0_g1_i1:31-396(+)
MRVAALLLALLLGAAAGAEVQHGRLLEACCCTTDFVDETFSEILTTLNALVQRPYFRYVRVDLEKPCPFWAVELLCSAGNDPSKPPPCQVCTCDEKDVPLGLRDPAMCGPQPTPPPPRPTA